MPNQFINPDTLHSTFGYTHVVATQGEKTVYISGQVPLDVNGALVGTDLGTQTHQVFKNLRAALAAVGADFSNVVKVTYYVTDMGQIAALREARNQYINTQNPPASTAVQVAALFRPDVLVEVEAIAVL